MLDRTATESLLAEARLAYHELATGRAVRVIVDQNGERIEYTAVSLANLAAYVASLERLLTPGTVMPPMGIFI